MGFPGSLAGKEAAYKAGDPGSIAGSGRAAEEGISYPCQYCLAFLLAKLAKYLPAKCETWVWCLCWEDPLEKGYSLQFSGLENSMDCLVHGGCDILRTAVLKLFPWFQSAISQNQKGTQDENKCKIYYYWARFSCSRSTGCNKHLSQHGAKRKQRKEREILPAVLFPGAPTLLKASV